MEYSKEITDLFLIKYRELETIQQNQNAKYQYLLNHFRSELDLFRHIRNDLSHDVIDSSYPFIVSKSCLTLLERLLKKVKEKAYQFAIKGNKLSYVYTSTPINKVIAIMSKYHYSYLPIVNDKHVVIGIVSGDSIIDLVHAKKIKDGAVVNDYIDMFSIERNENAFFLFIKRDTYFYELKENLNKYYDDKRKLGMIFITRNGSKLEPILGLLTPWDIIKNQD